MVTIAITGLKEHINVGRIIELYGIHYKVLKAFDCEIEDKQGQVMFCELVTVNKEDKHINEYNRTGISK